MRRKNRRQYRTRAGRSNTSGSTSTSSDHIMNLVEDLVINRGRLKQIAEQHRIKGDG